MNDVIDFHQVLVIPSILLANFVLHIFVLECVLCILCLEAACRLQLSTRIGNVWKWVNNILGTLNIIQQTNQPNQPTNKWVF